MKKTGILVLAHGSRNQEWVDLIDQAVQQVETDLPICTGFLELVPGRSIAEGVRLLERQGVVRIIVIPLFITMGSTHLNEIQYALGLVSKPLIDTDIEPIFSKAEMVWCSPLEDDGVVYQILTERLQLLSTSPQQEAILLIGHGSEIAGFHERWEGLLERVSLRLREHFDFKEAAYATLHPDNIAEQARILSKDQQLIVVPLFLSEGYFTKRVIPGKLTGISYVYDGKTFLPHPLISTWIGQAVTDALEERKKVFDDHYELVYTLNH